MLAAALACAALLSSLDAAATPHLERQGRAARLIVKNRPMLLLGGELGNSSASSAAYMAPYWPRLRQMHLNTVLAPVSWELLEPAEGQLNWQAVDALLAAARANQLKLVLLWFGAWKNSMSTYVPAWVKRDQSRFPRAKTPDGRGLDILSAFATATRAADSRAFCALLTHLRKVDGDAETVVMIQVENEIGMLPMARDYGMDASTAFHGPVPEDFIRAVAQSERFSASDAKILWETHGKKTAGDWPAIFGESAGTDELFTAFFYARYVESLVAAGKSVYPIPMYVNAALNRPAKAPGEYPSGGPLPHLLDTWKFAAPSLDLLAPDIYFPNFPELAARYRRPDNPLFIPEANRAASREVPANAFFAFGELDALGFGPFSIESMDDRSPNALASAYGVLEQLSPAILAAQGLDRMAGFRPRILEDGTVVDTPVNRILGHYQFTVGFVDTQSPQEKQNTASHGGIIIQVGPDEYLVAGQGIIVTFVPVGDGPAAAGIESDWEGNFASKGSWTPGRLLNGDQTHQGRHLRLAPGEFQIQRVRLYRYQ
jgi:beta-galactosidase GanA